MGELVICCAILTLAIMAMMVVFIKNAVEQNTSVTDVVLSIFKIKNSRIIVRKTKEKQAAEATGKGSQTGVMEEGRDMVTKDMEKKTETEPKAKKKATGFMADLASTMFLWQPSKLFTGRKEKFEERSKQIDSELDRLLAENLADEADLDPLYTPEKARLEIPEDVLKNAQALRESRLKGLFKDNKAEELKKADKIDPAPLNKESPAPAFKVEKLEIPEGVKPKWDAIVPMKEPMPMAQDPAMMESKIQAPEPHMAIPENMKDPLSAAKGDISMQLNINNKPPWGYTDLGKPLADFRSNREEGMAARASERVPSDQVPMDQVPMNKPAWGHADPGKPLADGGPRRDVGIAAPAGEQAAKEIQDKNEVMKMLGQTKNPFANVQPATDSQNKEEVGKMLEQMNRPLAVNEPIKAPPVKIEPVKPAAPVKAESKNIPVGMDFGNDILKELQEEEDKVEDDGALDIMHELKDKKIGTDELEFDALDVLSMIRTNVKSGKQSKAKAKAKPKLRPKA